VLPLGPVDKLSVLTVCDNTVDMLLPNEEPAKRLSLAGMARQAPMLGSPDAARGQGGQRAAGTARVLRADGHGRRGRQGHEAQASNRVTGERGGSITSWCGNLMQVASWHREPSR